MEQLFAVKYFAQKHIFFTSVTSRGQTGQICRQYCDGEFNSFSNAFFGFAFALIPEIMEAFRRDVRQSRKTRNFRHFWPLEVTILTLAKK